MRELNKNSVKNIFAKLDGLYEFDREPVPENKLYGGRYFAGYYAGEHIAATEFVIGALFVTWGASAFDIILGLAIGNLIAVLTWTFICAPISVQTRLTLYWYLRKICGPGFTWIYNIINAALYCVLAGCMITVSASAIRIHFHIPAQINWYPTDYRFVIIVLLVGVIVVTLAILGFKKLSQVAMICSPWMFLMFIVGAVAIFPALEEASGLGKLNSFHDFWELASQVIWTGKAASGVNASDIGFWHIVIFAWIANLAMHVGLSDMVILRYAKKGVYGLYSSTGMLLGHYIAWICAGIMGAGASILLKKPLTELDSGAVGDATLGLSGAIAVVLAGWTSANPTLYRVGLALQALTPNWPRWIVTLAAGVIITLIACFPFVFTEMLNFVGIYGLLLVSPGAIVLTEHWIFPRIGFTQYWAEKRRMLFNVPALLSWVISIVAAVVLWQTNTIHLFFIFIPIYFLTMVLYIVFAALVGARSRFSGGFCEQTIGIGTNCESDHPDQTVNETSPCIVKKQDSFVVKISGWLAVVSLVVCLAMSFRVFLSGAEDYYENLEVFKKWLTWPTLLYLLCSTIWITNKDKR